MKMTPAQKKHLKVLAQDASHHIPSSDVRRALEKAGYIEFVQDPDRHPGTLMHIITEAGRAAL